MLVCVSVCVCKIESRGDKSKKNHDNRPEVGCQETEADQQRQAPERGEPARKTHLNAKLVVADGEESTGHWHNGVHSAVVGAPGNVALKDGRVARKVAL